MIKLVCIGPIRQILHPFIYICVASSYLIMEAYIKWKTQLQNIDSIEGETKNMNKSGPISFSITLAFVIHTLSDFILPKLIKGNEYYLAKILISNMVLFHQQCVHVFKKQKCFTKVNRFYTCKTYLF